MKKINKFQKLLFYGSKSKENNNKIKDGTDCTVSNIKFSSVTLALNSKEANILHLDFYLHYENKPMQHTAIFRARKNDNFHLIFF